MDGAPEFDFWLDVHLGARPESERQTPNTAILAGRLGRILPALAGLAGQDARRPHRLWRP
jgi:hypothetical protein